MNFQEKVRAYYSPFYEEGDKAHKIDHADDVCNLALKINKNLDEQLVILSAYLHDIFNAQNRAIHNELAYDYVMRGEDLFLRELNAKALKEVAYAVLEHRASFKGVFYSPLSELISSADRGEPNLEKVILRSLKFNNGNAQDVYEHIKDKYGSNGYAKYPDVYRKIFNDELTQFQKKADSITVEEVEMLNQVNS